MHALLVVPLLLCVLHNAASLPAKDAILLHRNQRQSNGYQFEYEAEDGSRRQEIGTFVNKGDKTVLHVKGMYSYFGRDGRKYVVRYEADDKGTKTAGDIVPQLVPGDIVPPQVETTTDEVTTTAN
ncbi:hypothetical protein GEV33_006369 [Tenebrio molitor]|uniref:Uncharacterized protein n=1 Tax=Tenebrio molitor TaxID=7067 RepID=A0A8J6HL89_TENMO|nr:hypothetical protein GEV33_006369 [Tenebrio molitor]